MHNTPFLHRRIKTKVSRNTPKTHRKGQRIRRTKSLVIQRNGQGKRKLKRDKECTHYGAPPRARLCCPSPSRAAYPSRLPFFVPCPCGAKSKKTTYGRIGWQLGHRAMAGCLRLKRSIGEGQTRHRRVPPFLCLVPRVWTAPLCSSRPEISTRSVCSVLPRPPPLGLVKLTSVALITNTAFSSSHCTTSVKGLRGLQPLR